MIRRSLSAAYGTALIFCLLFSFRLPLIYNSAAFACVLSVLQLTFQPARYRTVVALVLNKYYFGLNAVVLLFFLYSMVATVVHGEYDFSFMSLAVSYVFYALAIPLVFGAVNSGQRANVENYIIYAFFLQSVIILLAFLVPSFRDAMRIFKDESQLELADSYYGGGLRGLALSGGLFFSLSCGYCLYFMLVAKRFAEKECSYVFLSAVLVSMFSGVTAGRTALIGMGIGIAVVLFQRFAAPDPSLSKMNIRRLAGMVAVFFCILLVAVPQKYLASAFESYMKFSFEMVFNFLEGKGLTTSSTDRLNEMYFPLEISEISAGDGRYTATNGSYFKQTDAGYMRNILLGGLPVVAFAMCHLGLWFRSMKRYCGRGRRQKYLETVFICSIAFMILILHYKGEAMLYVVMINNIIYLLFFDRMSKSAVAKQLSEAKSLPRDADLLGYAS
jgi:hypothetical protein